MIVLGRSMTMYMFRVDKMILLAMQFPALKYHERLFLFEHNSEDKIEHEYHYCPVKS